MRARKEVLDVEFHILMVFTCKLSIKLKGGNMENQTKLEAWKIFLKGRIAQEKGNNEEALKAFEDALKYDPDNRSFLYAKSNALAALNRSEEALVSRIQKGYGELAKKYVGENDKPSAWIEGLQKLIAEIESQEIAWKVTIGTVVW